MKTWLKNQFAPKVAVIFSILLGIYVLVAAVLSYPKSNESENDKNSVIGQIVLGALITLFGLVMATQFGRNHQTFTSWLLALAGFALMGISVVRTTTEKAEETVGKISKQVQTNMNTSMLVIGMFVMMLAQGYDNAQFGAQFEISSSSIEIAHISPNSMVDEFRKSESPLKNEVKIIPPSSAYKEEVVHADDPIFAQVASIKA